MHTVIESECTGCNLCIPPCPVDCIHIFEVQPTVRSWVEPPPPAGHAAPQAG
jgi:electron transport complex protein RnfB